jgi:outer membrane protein assembly factor BamB
MLEDALYAKTERAYKESTRYLPEIFYTPPLLGSNEQNELEIIKEGSDAEVMAWIEEDPEWLDLSFAKHRRVSIESDGSSFDPKRYDLKKVLLRWFKFLSMGRAYSVSGGLFDTRGKFYLLTPDGEVYVL